MRVPIFVIVGAGLAGARAAEAIRSEGFDGGIVLLAGEDEHPYVRPPLSKDYLAGTSARDTIDVHPAEWYRDRGIDVRLGNRVTGLALDTHEVTLEEGRAVRYDKLLLATGASSRRFPGSGAALDGVHHLRTVVESQALRAELEPGNRRVVIVGAGWIGLEVAAAARGYGNAVTVLGREGAPLAAVIGAEVGSVFAELHRVNGVELRTGTRTVDLMGAGGHVTGVLLSDGEVVPADVVVVGIGAEPNTELARDAGMAVDDGIVVDAAFRSIDPDVYAVGDVASVFHPVLRHHLRLEHWDNAERAGAAAGRSMLDQAVSYDAIPYFYTDQFDLGMEYSGYGTLARGAEVVFRGDRAGREFMAFWVADGQVVAGLNVNVWNVNETVQRFIRTGVRVDASRLADESIALDELLAGAPD
ncbi:MULTISPECIES: FAD-dependent oxidoreductase [Cryobacterium]|uniref:NAD(P)/FAD-dependent oxidoreductase n=1 Tax=Cryobacterium breve TaxID=1259258 RepID=A0ABY2J6Y9_9MICO|nr:MULTISPECIES: FAD-dependent oxidoreductase [Cryobacterium]TFC96293.1 NAD(P)/FAD-dependent oxidoreductase [Cryobacterium sp. TmT3-12]TFD00702.1 NAD(P)/FAD-dependent oxidoreductase [Cryobacterium breve]